jgi:forkhead box protein J2/3
VNDSVDPRTGVHRVRKKKGGGRGMKFDAREGAATSSAQYDAAYSNEENGRDYRYNGEPEGSKLQYGYPPPYVFVSFNTSGHGHLYVTAIFDASHPAGYPIVTPHNIRYADEAGDEDIEPDATSLDGHDHSAQQPNHNWRAIWLNELAKLQHVTSAQDNAGADLEWYRMMVERVRSAFMAPPPHHTHGSFVSAQDQHSHQQNGAGGTHDAEAAEHSRVHGQDPITPALV